MFLPRFASLTLAGGLLLSAAGCASDSGGGLFSRWRHGGCCGSTCGATGGTAPVMPIPAATYAPAQVVPGTTMAPPVFSGAGSGCCPPGATMSAPVYQGAPAFPGGAGVPGPLGCASGNCAPGGLAFSGAPIGTPVIAGAPGCATGNCAGAAPAFPAGLHDGAMLQHGPIGSVGQVPFSQDMMQQVPPVAQNNPLILQPAPMAPQPLPSAPNAPKIFTVPQPGSPTPSNYAVPEPYKPTTVIQPGI